MIGGYRGNIRVSTGLLAEVAREYLAMAVGGGCGGHGGREPSATGGSARGTLRPARTGPGCGRAKEAVCEGHTAIVLHSTTRHRALTEEAESSQLQQARAF